MKKTLWDLIKLCLPMGAEKHKAVVMAAGYLEPQEMKFLRQLLKLDRTFAVMQRFHTTPAFFADKEWPFFKSHLQDKELHDFLTTINKKITEKAKHEAFLAFAPDSIAKITKYIAPNIIGMDGIKTAAAAQLFAKDNFHLLLLGDPGTGKTEVLRSVHELAPISSFGLGSGTSGAGLSAMAKGDELIKGLLPLADGGIACVDELNLMKAKDMASLYNAMEKGFVSYDKGSKHETLPARVRVCATANPRGDTFIGKSAEILKKQLPFDDALISRFHLIFLVRKPTAEEFEKITSHIVKHDKKVSIPAEDAAFIKEYITFSDTLDIRLDEHAERQIVDFIKNLKADERRFITEIGPRTVVGVVRIAKAIARSHLAQGVDQDHINEAFALLREALYVRAKEETEKKTETKRGSR